MFTTGANSKNFNQNIKDLIKQRKNDKVKSHIKGMDPSKLVDSNKTSLLHLAAKYNNSDLAKHLIKIKCNINAKNMSKVTPLMVAAASNSFKTAQILIEAKADIYATNLSNISALNMLLNKRNIPQYLISCCLEKVKRDSSSDKVIAEKLFMANCPLSTVIRLENSNVTKIIFTRYGQLDLQQTRAAMNLALELQDIPNVEALLKCGVEVDISKNEAVEFLEEIFPMENDNKGYFSLFKKFLSKVTDWNSVREEDLDVFAYFFTLGSKQILELFLQYNVNDYVKNKFPGQDLFVNVFGNRNADAKELLKDLEFDVNAHGGSGYTALHHAVLRRCLIDVQTILNLGADPNSTDNYGHVPLSIMKRYLFPSATLDLDSDERKIVELLLLAGADPQLDTGRSWSLMFSPTKVQLMLAQLALNESMGTPIKEIILQDINRHAILATIYETCSQQLVKLKAMKVYGTITLYTILVTDAAKIADKLRDKAVLEAMSSDIEQLHFYYASRLKNSINQILHTVDLKKKASMFICETTGWPSSQ